jgi:hypothetical protein
MSEDWMCLLVLDERDGMKAAAGDLDVGAELYVGHVGIRTSRFEKNVYLVAKIFVCARMHDSDMREGGQNIERAGVAGKILWNKELLEI